MIDIQAKEKPKWYQFRWKLSNMFVIIAKKIYPESPEVRAFYMKQLSDMMIYGNVITRVDYSNTKK